MTALAHWSRRLRDSLAVLAALLVWCGAAWADPPGRVGRLADFSGTDGHGVQKPDVNML